MSQLTYFLTDASCHVVGDTSQQQITLADQPNQSITISSANYPNNYDDGVSCLWFFTAPEGSTITFTLLNFVVEHSYDFVRIGSGSNHLAQQVHELTGTNTGVTRTIGSNEAWMTFTSDASSSESGFQIRVSYSTK